MKQMSKQLQNGTKVLVDWAIFEFVQYFAHFKQYLKNRWAYYNFNVIFEFLRHFNSR